MAKVYLPKQTSIIFVICLLVVGGVYLYVYGKPNLKASQKMAFSVGDKIPEVSVANSANTSDWQKQFVSKDNPTAFKTPPKASPDLSREPLTTTDLLGRDFFTKYMQLRQAGLTTDEQSVNQATNQIIADSLSAIPTPQAYSAKEISVIAADDIVSLKNYASTLIGILYTSMPEKNEAEIAMEAFQKDDLTLLGNIDPIIKEYKNALEKLRETSVPQSLSQYHLDLINGLSMQYFNAQSLRQAGNDPIRALAAVGLEVKSLGIIANALANMQVTFTKAGITFVLPTSGSIIQ